MGIGDLFVKKQVESAITSINNKSDLIKEAMIRFYKNPEFNMAQKWDDSLLIPYVMGDLLRSYLHLLDSKSKEAKTFFKDEWFYQHASNSIKKIYELARQADSVNKRYPEIAQRAQESLNDIYEYSLNFSNNQRKRK